MRRFLLFSFIFIPAMMHIAAFAQILPEEASSLHYRLIGFSFPKQENATGYRLEIFQYIANINKTTPLNPIITKEQKNNRIIAIVPTFGKRYMWRVNYLNRGKVIGTDSMHYFSVNANPFSAPPLSRVLTITSASKYKYLLLFFDNTRTLYNMSGEALWYLPVIQGITDSTAGVIRDLKLTADGTITFLTSKNVHEIDYYGNLLWSGPNDGKISGKATDQYHHQFTKLANGHYMTIGNKFIPDKILKGLTGSHPGKDSELTTPCGTVIEYNRKKEIVWTWNSCDYIKQGDPGTHFNSFYFDNKNNIIYTGYRNISRIVKAAYPSGKLLAQYGADINKDGRIKGDGLFYSQHNCGINSDGNLILFNNNFNMSVSAVEREGHTTPSILVLKEPVNAAEPLQKIWEFKCDIDTFVNPTSSGGGSVYELNKGDYLVCTGTPGRNFIVSKDKKIIWNVITQQREGNNWKPVSGYRISPVHLSDLDKLLFR